MWVIRGLAVVAAFGFAAPGRAAETWNFYHSQSLPQFATSRSDAALTRTIEALSGGALHVRFHLAGTLQINSTNMAEAVSNNVVQMGDDFFFSGTIPVASIARLPFLVQSYEDFDTVERVLRPFVEKAYAAKGVVMLAPYAYTYQFVFGRRKIGSLSDFDGQKIRTSSPEQSEFIRRFNGISVSMTAAEVPSALDRGVMDGLITGTVGAASWEDLIQYGYLLRIGIPNAYLIVNATALGKLTPELQDKIRKAAEKTAAENTETLKQEDSALYDKLQKDGIILTVPTEEDRARAVATMVPYWQDWAKANGPEAEEALQQVRAALHR